MKIYTFYCDAGHGWLQVPKQQVKESNAIYSVYSYEDQDYIYLEEDVDMERFLEFLKEKDISYSIIESSKDAQWIRNLSHYANLS